MLGEIILFIEGVHACVYEVRGMIRYDACGVILVIWHCTWSLIAHEVGHNKDYHIYVNTSF